MYKLNQDMKHFLNLNCDLLESVSQSPSTTNQARSRVCRPITGQHFHRGSMHTMCGVICSVRARVHVCVGTADLQAGMDCARQTSTVLAKYSGNTGE